MKLEDYLDLMLDKDTDDIIFLDENMMTIVETIDYDSNVVYVSYKKIAYIMINKNDNWFCCIIEITETYGV